MQNGRLHIYHGDGKGKTTAAMGLALRAAGQGLRVGVAQFLKDGTSGEILMLRRTDNVTVLETLPRVPFVFAMSAEQREEAQTFYAGLLRRCAETAANFDLLILDEVLDAVNTGILSEEALFALVKERRAGLELVLTGRGPSDELLAQADYITQMVACRHPYEKGVAARRGIEW